MKTILLAVTILLFVRVPAAAHRLDEYLQAAILSVDRDRIAVSLRLVPGVAVTPAVLAAMDKNGDGALSNSEQHAYAEQVLRDLSLIVDGQELRPRLLSLHFPEIQDLKQGMGEIQLEFAANLVPGRFNRKIAFENHHRPQKSAYLMNCLVPQDQEIRILAQNRNHNQSFFQLDYQQSGNLSGGVTKGGQSSLPASLGDSFSAFPSMFRLGMRHIAEGTDHLLFLLALLLPAPLLVSRSRWSRFAGVRHSILQTLGVVTAFTIGHSITLALAALGLVRVPSRPIEILIAVSILISAAHALRPLFPGREAAIAGGFGLMHGLAFAATLQNLGLGWSQRLVSILSFNLGIETMQLMVVAAFMPALISLSRTRAYPPLRIGGAIFAVAASAGWIAERVLNLHTPVDAVAGSIAHGILWIAPLVFLVSLASQMPLWSRQFRHRAPTPRVEMLSSR